MVVNDGTVQRSTITSLTITFNTLVTIDYGAFELMNLAGGYRGLIVTPINQGGVTVVTLTFAPFDGRDTPLADGRYSLRVFGDGIFNTWPDKLDGDNNGGPGGDYTYKFFRLLGDFNGDGVVNALDQSYLQGHIGKSKGQIGYDSVFDLDGDGVINIADYMYWKKLIGHKV